MTAITETHAIERFIPYRSVEVMEMLCVDGKLSATDQKLFRTFCATLASIYHFEFHAKVIALKGYYHPFDPDKDTHTKRIYSPDILNEYEVKLIEKLTEVLNDANYEKVTDADIKYALNEESLFPISLAIDFEDFASYMIQRRGDIIKNIPIIKWWFWKASIDVPMFERVIMLIKFKSADYFIAKGRKQLPFEPGSMVIKLFKNIPKADLEMLFPNARITMRLSDKLMIGVPAISGAVGIVMKTGAGLLAFIVVLHAVINHLLHGSGFAMPGPAEFAQIIAGITALSAIVGFVFQQWAKYKNRKIEFLKTLGDNLYFKNLDNNVGVFHHIVDAAEEEESKEVILSYYFLLQHPEGLSELDLDKTVENWFVTQHNVYLDFEVDDALRKLKKLGLCTIEPGEIYRAIDLNSALERINTIWANIKH